MTDLDPKLTFGSFVVGPANRLASAAAKRAADSPGTSYNPLFLYSASGLGKSHILNAIANQASKNATDGEVVYMALEKYLAELEAALEAGDRDGFKDRHSDLAILLLDDVQFLTGQPEAQEMLLRTIDEFSTAGSQIVLASDRPPADINGLDARLLSRFSGGLIVDIGVPEYETRVAIIRKRAEARGQSLDAGVAEALGRIPFRNVRELGGALNKIFAIQDLEERQVSTAEIAAMMGEDKLGPVTGGIDDEFGSFLDEMTETLEETVEQKEAPWRKAIRAAIDTAEREGFDVARLQAYQDGNEPDGWQGIVDAFTDDVQRLRDIEQELDRLGNSWPDAAAALLKNPGMLSDAEALLTTVRERQRPFLKVGAGPSLADLEGFPPIATKAATELVAAERPEYNPLYVWSADPARARTLLAAAARTHQTRVGPEIRTAVTSAAEFAEDFIRALGAGVAGAWRERWWTVDALMVHGTEALSETERAQDEFFHLFEALKRRGARVLLVGDRPPAGIEGIDARLRSRFEGGLVLEVDSGTDSGKLELVEAEEPRIATLHDDDDSDAQPVPIATQAPSKGGAWFPSAENVILMWPTIDDLLIEELD
jgi:chromosomal replication initiation ATPase DnaA